MKRTRLRYVGAVVDDSYERAGELLRALGATLRVAIVMELATHRQRFVHELLRTKKLSDETFDAAQQLLGTKGVVDLTLTCSYYTAINLSQIALKPEMAPGLQSTL